MLKKSLVATAIALLFTTLSAQAEYMGLLSGRSANPGNMTDLSVELGFVTGDLEDVDYQNIGARVNFRVSPELVVFGDVGISEFGVADGTPFGLGAIYFLSNQRISDNLDIAGKASYHTGEYDIAGFNGDISGLSFEVLISGQEPISDDGLNWYANFGFHRLSVDFGLADDSSNELGLGGGVVLPAGPGEVYAGLDLIDEITFGIGFRYFVQ
ncbi:MAG: hypothetical protein AB8B79_02760 [Granulosicoccus sp.]